MHYSYTTADCEDLQHIMHAHVPGVFMCAVSGSDPTEGDRAGGSRGLMHGLEMSSAAAETAH